MKIQSRQPVRPEPSVRLDKWLWAARFFKTRQLAVQAITGGHVHIDGQRVKPSRLVKKDVQLDITKAGYRFVVQVVQLSAKRGSASIAQQLYEETPASIVAREKIITQRKQYNASVIQDKKPDKRTRCRIIRFKQAME